MSRSIKIGRAEAAPARHGPLALERIVPFFVVAAVIVSSLVPATAFAGTRDWWLWRTPSSVTGPAASVTLTAANTGDGGGGEAVGCVTVSIPNAGFLVTGVSVDAVSDGDSWSATSSIGATATQVRIFANSGGGERLHGDPSEWVRATVSFATTGSDGTYTWSAQAYNKEDCTDSFLMPRAVTVTVNGAAPNSAPTALDDGYATTKNAAVMEPAAGVLSNDDDPDGDPITVVQMSGPSNGSLTLNPDGSFTYTPVPGFLGTDSFTYRASDGSLQSATATVTVTVSNSPPTASDDAYGTVLGLPVSVSAPGVLGNDGDADGDSLTASLVSGPAHGSLSLDADGAFTYSPDLLYLGTDSFVYRVSDGTDFADATVYLNVVNDPPTAADDGPYLATEDTTLSVSAPGVLVNDADADGHAISAQLVGGAANGTVSLAADGSFDYVPDFHFNGTDSFTYRASDGLATSPARTVTLSVAAVDDPPTSGPDAYAAIEDTSLAIPAPGVLANDGDVDGDPLTASLVTPAANGTATVGADGSVHYVPDPETNGIDSFTYSVTDGTTVLQETVTVSVAAVNDPPIAIADATSTPSGAVVLVDAVSNDTDIDGDALSLSAVGAPSTGSATAQGGRVRFVPAPGFSGVVVVPYTVSDGTASDAGSVTITVLPPVPVPTPPSTPQPTATPAPDPVPSAAPTATPSPTDEPLPSRTPETRDPGPSPTSPAVVPAARPTASEDAPSPVPSATPATAPPSPTPTPDPTQTVPALESPELTTAIDLANQVFSLEDLIGNLGGRFGWAVPAAVLGVPGLLFMLAVIGQVFGAAAWIPAIRRMLAGIGVRRGEPSPSTPSYRRRT